MSISLLRDHAAYPRHRREVLDMSSVGHAANPMCADSLNMGIRVEEGKVTEAAFSGSGCALAMGSASLLCEWLQGRSVEDVKSVLDVLPHLQGEEIGRMREGCVRVSVVAFYRALDLSTIS